MYCENITPNQKLKGSPLEDFSHVLCRTGSHAPRDKQVDVKQPRYYESSRCFIIILFIYIFVTDIFLTCDIFGIRL